MNTSLVQVKTADIHADSAFASDLGLRSFPKRLQLFADDSYSVRALDRRNINRKDGSIVSVEYAECGGFGAVSLVIYND